MTRFSTDEKREAVIRYLNGDEGYKTVAKSIGVHHSVIFNWIKKYKHHGDDAFNKSYTAYSAGYKLDVLHYMNENGTSVRETAAIFNIASHSTLLNWQKSLKLQGIDALQPKNKGRSNHKRVQRLMKVLGLKCLVLMKKYRSYKGTIGKIAFHSEKPNEKWVTDITEFKLFGEKLYLSPILDLYNGEIITYTIGSSPVYSLVSTMLDQAFSRVTIGDKLLIHSDQGWHYQMKQYQHALKERGIKQSMSRKGNCYDNAVIENFFGIMKSEFLYVKEFQSIEHFKQELSEYIDYYNHKRIKAKLKGMSPVQYRTHAQQIA